MGCCTVEGCQNTFNMCLKLSWRGATPSLHKPWHHPVFSWWRWKMPSLPWHSPSVRLCPVLCCHVCLFCCCSFFYCIFHFHGPQTIWWPFMAAADSGQKSTPIKTWITGQENMHVWMICCGQECAWYSILCIDCIFIVNMCKGMCKCVGGRCPLLNVQTDSRKLIRPIWWREQIRAAWYIRFCYLKIPLVSFYLKLLGFSLWWNKIQYNFWWWLTRLLSYICGHRVDKSSETITMGRIGVVSMYYM